MTTFAEVINTVCNGTPEQMYATNDKNLLVRYWIVLENEINMFNDITEQMYDGEVSITQLNGDLTASTIVMNEGIYLQRANWVKQIYPIYKHLTNRVLELITVDEFFELYKILFVEYAMYIAELKNK